MATALGGPVKSRSVRQTMAWLSHSGWEVVIKLLKKAVDDLLVGVTRP